MQPKVSVIVPVYKVEQYIERCVRSLFEQTLDSLEYIFVDDCSPDSSIKVLERVLEEYPHRKSQVKIIRHETNQGVGQSRQQGIDSAKGEYLIHCDPDDWVDADYYEALYRIATREKATVVIGNYIKESKSESIQYIPDQYASKNLMFNGITTFKFHMGLWNKLIKKDLMRKYRIPEGVNLWEDMSIMVPILMDTDKITFCREANYHYRVDNPTSICNTNSTRNALSQIRAVQSIDNVLHQLEIINEIDNRDLLRLKWYSKRTLLVNPTSYNCELWRCTFPECNTQYRILGLPLKSIALSWLLTKQMDFVVRLVISHVN